MDYERLTIYVQDATETRKWIDRLRLVHDEAYQADKAEIHDAMVEVARDHEDELLSKLAGDER